MLTWRTILLVVIVALVVAVIATLRTRHRAIKKVAYMMDALEDGELNFRFKDSNRFNRTLNRIRTIFEKQRQEHEQDSWTKLIRVLTHEIMNTVSPIASLSDAMAKSVDESGHSELDIKAGLETISDSSKNLIGFVQTYRQLSGVAKPVRKALTLQELMDSVISLNSEFAASCGAVCTYRPEEPDLMVYADEGQISQILINLIKNALQAGAKHIDISARMDKDDEVIVQVANDGEPIPVSAQEQIFIEPRGEARPASHHLALRKGEYGDKHQRRVEQDHQDPQVDLCKHLFHAPRSAPPPLPCCCR